MHCPLNASINLQCDAPCFVRALARLLFEATQKMSSMSLFSMHSCNREMSIRRRLSSTDDFDEMESINVLLSTKSRNLIFEQPTPTISNLSDKWMH